MAGSASFIPSLCRESGESSSSISARSPRSLREVVVYEDVISYPAVKQDLSFVVAEGGQRAGRLVAAAREAAGPGAARGWRSPTSTADPDRRGEEVDHLRGRLPVLRADALGRGRGACARRSSRRSASASARLFAASDPRTSLPWSSTLALQACIGGFAWRRGASSSLLLRARGKRLFVFASRPYENVSLLRVRTISR